MKLFKLLPILLCVLFFGKIEAQDEIAKNSKFSLVPYAGIGFAKIENENEPNYNLNVNQGTLLINYAFSDADEFGLATGIGFTELSGNAFNADGSFYHERNQLRIPLLLTINYPISDSFQVFTNFGAYAQTILKDEYQFATGILEDVYEGWNFGMQFSIGLLFDFTENWSLGLQVDAQSDLSKFDANRNVTSVVNNTSTPGEQKIEGLSAIGIIARLRL